MSKSNISSNFDLLRWQYGTHKALHRRLHLLLTWNQLSAYALGNKEPPDELLQKIESELKLPTNWFKRDNVGVITIAQEIHSMLASYLKLSSRERKAVDALLAGLSAA